MHEVQNFGKHEAFSESEALNEPLLQLSQPSEQTDTYTNTIRVDKCSVYSQSELVSVACNQQILLSSST